MIAAVAILLVSTSLFAQDLAFHNNGNGHKKDHKKKTIKKS